MESVEESRPLTAAERRERRIQKILGNSESRINAILSGPDGDEQRNAPAVEGSFQFNDRQTPSVVSTEEDHFQPVVINKPSLIEGVKNYLPKKLFAVILFGVFARLAMLGGYELNIILPWITMYISVELLFNREVRLAKMNNELVQTLLAAVPMQFSPRIKDFGYIFSLGRDLTTDTMDMISGFIVTHALLIIGNRFELF